MMMMQPRIDGIGMNGLKGRGGERWFLYKLNPRSPYGVGRAPRCFNATSRPRYIQDAVQVIQSVGTYRTRPGYGLATWICRTWGWGQVNMDSPRDTRPVGVGLSQYRHIMRSKVDLNGSVKDYHMGRTPCRTCMEASKGALFGGASFLYPKSSKV
jgi:hypothetical protein